MLLSKTDIDVSVFSEPISGGSAPCHENEYSWGFLLLDNETKKNELSKPQPKKYTHR